MKLIKSSPEESQIEDEQYWIQKISNVDIYLSELLKKYKSLKDFKKINKMKSKKDLKFFEFAPTSILKNRSIMLKALNDNFIYYHQIDESLKNNRNFALKYLQSEHSYYFVLPKELLRDEEIFNLCIEKDSQTYLSIFSDQELYLKYKVNEKAFDLLSLNPKIYEHFLPELKNDLAISKKAVLLDLNNAKYIPKKVSSKIFNEIELNRKLMEKNLDLFIKINNKFRDNEEFLIPLIKRNPSLVEFASPRLKSKKDFMIHAVSFYSFIKHIPDELKKDPELMTLHIANCFESYWEVKKFQDIKPLLFNILKKTYYIYKSFNEEMKSDEDYIYALLSHDYFLKSAGDFSLSYEQVSIIKLIPEQIRAQLVEEYHEMFSDNSNKIVPTSDELLSYARKKYSNLYLQKELTAKNDNLKIKI